MNEFKSVVFAGGGIRCFWETGFWDTASSGLSLKPDVVAGVSAGAAMAAMAMSGTHETGLRILKDTIKTNRKNFYFSNLFRKEPAFPHFEMYRNALRGAIDSAALKKIKEGPEIRVILAHPPRLLSAGTGIVMGFSAYVIEKYIKSPVHPRFVSKLGYTTTVVRLNDCTSPEELIDIIMCSSCLPPFIPLHRHNGRVTLDGGLTDNVPVSAIGKDSANGDMLVLLSMIYGEKNIPRVPGRVYVQPLSEPALGKWDFTDPAALQKSFDMGRRDGEAFVKQFSRKGSLSYRVSGSQGGQYISHMPAVSH